MGRRFLAGIAVMVACLALVRAGEPPDAAKVETVVADGVGVTADEAVKDAVRNAVRQVVGVLVDAETLVKNDEVVADKILTLSNGFVRKFEKLSEKKDGGLVRVRVKAEVERGQVAARLKEFKVTVKDVDGERVSVEKMTKEEVQKNTTELLKKVLGQLPKTLKAEAVGDPRAVAGKYVFKIRVEPDRKALAGVGQDLEALLAKAHVRHDSLLLPNVAALKGIGPDQVYFEAKLDNSFFTPPDESTDRDLAVWVMNWVGEKHEKVRLNGYLLRGEAREVLAAVEGKYRVRVELLDASGGVITEDEFVPHGDDSGKGIYKHTAWFAQNGNGGEYRFGNKKSVAPRMMLLTPTIGQLTQSGSNKSYSGTARVEHELPIKATDDEIKRLKQVRCTVQFKPSEKAK